MNDDVIMKMPVEEIKSICNKYTNSIITKVGNVSYGYCVNNQPDFTHRIVKFYGGENGCIGDRGKWSRYLSAIKKLVEDLETEFDHVWVESTFIDSIDDVFSVRIAVQNKEN